MTRQRVLLVGREQEVVVRYESGESARALAKSYGVGDQTVIRLLARRGIARRRTQSAGAVRDVALDPAPDLAIEALRPVELAYIAGLIDGEGCLLIYRKKDKRGVYHFRSILRISNTSVRVIRWLQERLGGEVAPSGKPGELPVYHWPIEGPRLAQLLITVRPYLVIKVELADLLVEMQRTMIYSGSGLRLPAEIRDQRDAIFDRYRTERREMRGR